MSEIRKARQNLKQDHIDFYRQVCHKEVLDDMHEQTMKKNKQERDKKRDDIAKRKSLFLKQFRMFMGYERDNLRQAQENPEEFFMCDASWPQCRFDFTRPHVLVDDFVFKYEGYENLDIFQDYFNPNKMESRCLTAREKPT